jgi:hypothetical protein
MTPTTDTDQIFVHVGETTGRVEVRYFDIRARFAVKYSWQKYKNEVHFSWDFQLCAGWTEIRKVNKMQIYSKSNEMLKRNQYLDDILFDSKHARNLCHSEYPSVKIDCSSTRRLDPFSWLISLTFRDDQQCQVEREIHVISVCMFCAVQEFERDVQEFRLEWNEHCRTYINISIPKICFEIHFHMLNA